VGKSGKRKRGGRLGGCYLTPLSFATNSVCFLRLLELLGTTRISTFKLHPATDTNGANSKMYSVSQTATPLPRSRRTESEESDFLGDKCGNAANPAATGGAL
jgi:hypothetical protein